MAVSKKSIDNLKPAQEGEVRNPKGRPKGSKSSATIIKKWLKAKEEGTDPITKKKKKLSQLDIIILKQLVKARKGDTKAFVALLDRAEGKPKQLNEHSGPDGTPIPAEIKHTVIFKKMNGTSPKL